MNVQFRRMLGVFYPGRFGARKSRRNGSSFAWKRFVATVLVVFALVKFALFFFYYNTFISLQYDVEEAAAQVAPKGDEPDVDPSNHGDTAVLAAWHEAKACELNILSLKTGGNENG